MSKKNLIIGFLMLILGVTTIFYWSSQKEVWFCDEIYTFESANGFEQPWPSTLIGQWQSGKDVESYFAADWDTLSLKSISDHLYSDHVPLYFWIFRILSVWFFSGSGTIWIGMSINLVFYLCVIALVYHSFVKTSKNASLAGVITFITCMATRLILQQSTTLRMYVMLLLAEMLLLAVYLRILKNSNEPKTSFSNYIMLFLVSLFGFLTHYHYWVFYAITAFMFCAWLLLSAIRRQQKHFMRSREFRIVLYNVGAFVLSLVSTILIFPYCRWNLNRGKGSDALHSVFDFSSEKLKLIAWGYERLSKAIFGEQFPVILGLLLIFGCVIGAIFLLAKKQKYDILPGYIITVLITQAYQIAVCFTMPAAWEERYLWGSFSILMWCAVYGGLLLLQEGMYHIKENKKRKISSIILSAALSLVFFCGGIAVIDGGDGIAYLSYPGKNREELKDYKDIPWIVYGPTVGVYSYYDWIIPEEICFLSMDPTEIDQKAVREMSGQDEFILYLSEDLLPAAIEFLEGELQTTLDIQYLMPSTNLKVYKVYSVK